MIQKLIALFMLILLQPIFWLVSLIIIINDGFPIIYIQKKYGKNHKEFSFYKFRTMKNHSPEIPTEEFENAKNYILKSGKFLRKFSIDELPQLLNIIKGDMKFIGPRPSMIKNEEMVKKMREEKGVDQLVPGITGWAQVNGRDLNSFEKKVELDHYYMLNKSFLLDIKILIMTIKVVLLRTEIKH